MPSAFDREWYLALKSALQSIGQADRRALRLVWEHPGVPTQYLPEKLGQKRGGSVWLAIGDRIAKKRLWPKMPRRIRRQNEPPGYLPFYSGVLVKLSSVMDRDGNRRVCFDFHDEAVRALQELGVIDGKVRSRSKMYTPIDSLPEDDIPIAISAPAETKKSLQSIILRRGQAEFRRALIQAYEGRCAVTGCSDVMVLEAAHIKKFSKKGRYEVSNGLLLRSDWHVLFDLNLWTVHPRTLRILVSKSLSSPEFVKLSGKRLRVPSDPKQAPSSGALQTRLRDFQKIGGSSSARS